MKLKSLAIFILSIFIFSGCTHYKHVSDSGNRYSINKNGDFVIKGGRDKDWKFTNKRIQYKGFRL